LGGFTKFFFKQILKVSAFYLEKQKIIISKKKLSHCQYQNNKAWFTDPIFSEGLGEKVVILSTNCCHFVNMLYQNIFSSI
jgi:hypothetical protein